MSEKVAAPAPAPRVADRVSAVRAPQLARKCCAAGAPGCSKCEDESNAHGMLQRKAAHGGLESRGLANTIGGAIGGVLRSPGRALDSDTRSFMESRFGYDFSNVRIHTGADAAASAQAVGAHAYTVGGDIVFDSGKYDPHSSHGRELLAHELTHTIQQSGMAATSLHDLQTTTPGDSSEREADAIAREILAGNATKITPGNGAGVMRLARFSNPKPVADPKALAKLQAAGITEVGAAEEKNQVLRRFEVAALDLPKEKGPDRAVKLWQDKTKLTKPSEPGTDANATPTATFSALETIIEPDGHYKGMLKAARSDPKTLRRFWLTNVGVGITHATDVWNRASKIPPPGVTKDFMETPLPAVGAPACQVDHVIELHIGGADAPPNMQMLSGPSNTASQAAIRSQIIGHAKIIREALALAHLPAKEIAIRYLTVNPAPNHTDPCTTIEEEVRKIAADPNEKVQPTVETDTDPYPISAMGLPAELRIGKGAKSTKIVGNTSNEQFAGLVPGMLLQELHHDKAPHIVKAKLDDSSKARLPITVTKGEEVDLKVVNKVLTVPPKPHIEFTFPYMSKGTISKLDFTPEGVHAIGTLIPSFPFLSKIKLGIEITPKSAIATLSPDAKLPSIGGLHFFDPKLSFPLYPEFKPTGSIGFYYGGNKEKPLLGGVLAAGVEGTDFVASADVNANVPGLDTGTGTVKYHRTRGWSGSAHISTSSRKVLKEAAVDVSMDDDGVEVTGTVIADVPGTSKDVTLIVKRAKNGEMTYSAETTIAIRGLQPAKLNVIYGTKGFSIFGKAPFKLFDKEGVIDVWYTGNAFGGSLKNFPFVKGRASVVIEELKFNDGKFSGKGSASMPLGDKFTATGRVALSEDGELAIAASLKISRPIPLFDPIKGDYKFFEVGIDIPIPGASIGNLVGLIARVEGSLSAGYTIGPAVIQEAELSAGMKPFEKDDSGRGVSFKGRITMPASAYISGKVSGQVALSAFIAEVAGGLSLEAKATLNALSSIDADVLYTPQRFTFHGGLDASLDLVLGVALTAYVVARVGLTDYFSTETRKDWTLGEWKFKPGLALTMNAAFDYASDKAFQMPTIQFNKPAINSDKLIRGGFGEAKEKETPSS